MKRRDFVKNISIAGAGISLFNPSPLFARSAETKVRLGIIGTGLRGQNHLWNALQRSDVDVVAICDIDERMYNPPGSWLQNPANRCQKYLQAIRTRIENCWQKKICRRS